MIHALDILKTTDRITIGNNIKMTLLSKVYLIVSPFYKDEEIIPVKISYKKPDMTEEEFRKNSHKNYFSGLPEVKIEKETLIKNSKVMTKFVLSMVHLNWTSHRVFVAKQERKTLDKIGLPSEILEKFDTIFDNYEKILLTNTEGFNQRIDILHKFYSK